MTSGVSSSERRISSQIGGPGLRCRTAQTRTAANSKTSGPTAPSRTCSALPGLGGQARGHRGHRAHRLARRPPRRLAPARVRRDARRRVRRSRPWSSSGTSTTYRCPSSSISSRKSPCLAVLLVGDDPVQAASAQHRDVADQLGGDLRLGAERQALGDVGLVAPAPGLGRVLVPGLGQVEPVVQQRRPRGGDADQEDADLAVVLLAEPAVVLPRHAGALGPLLGEGRLVDDADDADRRAGRRGGQLVGEGGLDLGLDVVVLPGGDVDELLEARRRRRGRRSRAIGSMLLRSGQLIRPLR